MFLVKKKIGLCSPQCPPVCIYDQVFVHMKVSRPMPSGSHMDAHRIYDLTLA